ncbi:waprin-Rha1 [Asbolus verrucosus]|uniref:Waprin-Rha1 n=1 Tax=Asbolus verrucosus TaxID=1661398 RepID=A0A482VLQ3_ASBVE|nr:waprin-Rha1 [Asbolus verrucosus]
MLAKLFLIVFLLIFVDGQRKPGDCPPVFNMGVCEMTCFNDFHCEGAFKCCRTTCGGTLCTVALAAVRPYLRRDKPGNCPEEPNGPWVCSSRCAYDSDCRGRKKCCQNRCGAMACTKPEIA